ncbi:hypothetical protein ACWDR0_33620 [Streptomyces sp. NPDC003691]
MLLVIGLVFAHGVNRESPLPHTVGTGAGAHGASAVVAPATAVPPTPQRPAAASQDTHAGLPAHSDGSVHPAERCMPGQPQLNSGTQSPGSGPPAPGAVRDLTAAGAAYDGVGSQGAAPRCAPVTGILRI